MDKENRIVMTLDAGGTNFVFSAIQNYEAVIEDITLPSNADNLDKCLSTITEGFTKVKEQLDEEPVAISFAFPGPADYPNGIIGDLGNLPAFRGGIALGPMLQEQFGIPAYINNDGDLYAYGEAIGGFLKDVNKDLEKAGSPKRYKNLVGFTLGTGFGAGIVRDEELFIGDNSGAGEVWLLRDSVNPEWNIEEHASIRGIRRVYARESKISFDDAPTPKDIYEIAIGEEEGDTDAAIEAFRECAKAIGDAIANVVTLVDGLVVIGGGLSGASDLFLPMLIEEMKRPFTAPDGSPLNRIVPSIYNLNDSSGRMQFMLGKTKDIKIPGTDKIIKYDSEKRIGIGITKIGTSRAVSIGAYAFALKQLRK